MWLQALICPYFPILMVGRRLRVTHGTLWLTLARHFSTYIFTAGPVRPGLDLHISVYSTSGLHLPRRRTT
jgi:hypothetical protein